MFDNLTEAQKNLEPKLFRTIHREAVRVVEEIKTKEVQLIRILQEADEYFVYRYFGFTSLYMYCLKALKLTEAQSVMYVAVARKSKQLPALQQALESGAVTVSKVKRVIPVINNENQEHWLDLVQNSSKRQIEKEVAKVNPRFVHPEKTRYLSDTVMELQTPLSVEIFELIKRAQEVISQKTRKPVKFEETLKTLAEYYLEKEDPIEREKRREAKAQKKAESKQNKKNFAAPSPSPGPVTEAISVPHNSQSPSDVEFEKHMDQTKTPTDSKSKNFVKFPSKKAKAIKRTTKDKVLRRDGGRCTYREGSHRCTQRIFLHTHHVLHRQSGGTNDPENLVTLCSAHHQLEHGEFH